MPVEKMFEDLDDISVVKRRFELMTVAEYRDKERIKKASKSMDEIRRRVGKEGKSMIEIIRDWREKRYVSSGS